MESQQLSAKGPAVHLIQSYCFRSSYVPGTTPYSYYLLGTMLYDTHNINYCSGGLTPPRELRFSSEFALNVIPLAKSDLQYSVIAVFIGKRLNFRGRPIDAKVPRSRGPPRLYFVTTIHAALCFRALLPVIVATRSAAENVTADGAARRSATHAGAADSRANAQVGSPSSVLDAGKALAKRENDGNSQRGAQ
eukprot:5004469-Pleurochrysis_carterae.AAC.1